MVQLKWTKQAVKDLKNIHDFIAADSKYYAKRQILKLKLTTQPIKTFPNIGRIVPEFGLDNLRELISGHYRIVYKIISEFEIHIITVHHSSKKELEIKVGDV